MKRGLIVAGAVALAVVVGGLALLTLPACGLRLPFGLGEVRFCPAVAMARADDLSGQRDALLQQISEAEGRLTALQCTPVAEPAALPPPLPDVPPDAPLDREIIEAADPAALQGCWALASDYATVDPDSGAVIDFSDWQVCLAEDGKGRQVMRGSDGTVCEGDVTVVFKDGELVIDEPGDLPCSNQYSIYQRQVICRVDEAGIAQCRSVQPAMDGDVTVIMRRSEEQP